VNNTELRIYATPYETNCKIPTLMHDITYRQAIAWQNNHYNQPANTSFYMGAETETVPAPEIKTTSGKVNPDLQAADKKHLELSTGNVISTLCPPPPPAPAPFTDTHSHWAIDYAYSKGIIHGMTDTTFVPDGTVTKGQFATMIVNATGLPTAKTEDGAHWAQTYADAAKEAGLIDENIAFETTADLDAPITREEMTSIMVHAIEYRHGRIPSVILMPIDDMLTFDDTDNISDWAVDDVKKAMKRKIISGFEDNTFRPKETATRAQAAVMITRL
ncbi:MAG: hypothetical protein HFE52_07970, partial [Clostridia bacterium]|nr:hypothetical protein [Clostridia bacterium]